ncbi:protein lin-52 homolog isoform X2 [Dysidea avara]|uniref:protein lin-52 homolog isoform X2 n=1 Tax=Dysidea avara TaxID=196820 RepID=UPI00332DF96E
MATGDNGHNTGNTQTKLVDNLMATEKMADSDEASTPSLWTEHNFFDEANPLMLSPARPRWLEEIEKPDIEMIKELGSLTKSQLLEKIKELQGIAYQLGLEEDSNCVGFQPSYNRKGDGTWKMSGNI